MNNSPNADCPKCDGRGYLESDGVDAYGEYEGNEQKCDDCDGTGRAFCYEIIHDISRCLEPAVGERDGHLMCEAHVRRKREEEVSR